MRRRLPILLAAPVLLALGAGGWFLHQAMAPANPAVAALHTEGARVETIGGETVVVVPADMQHASGIAVSPLAAAQVQAELLAYASVIDPQPLFDLGTRLAAATAERKAAQAQAGVSAAQAARTQALYEDDRNASQKSLQDARALAQSDQAKLAASEATLAGIRASMRQQFGDRLALAASSPTAGLWPRLVSGQAAVLRVVVASTGALPDSLAFEAPMGGTLTGHKLSAAPQVDPMLQGVAWFYLVPAALPAGMRTLAHAASGQQGAAGVLVPEEAVFWYGDTRWTYVRTASERFTRRLVRSEAAAPGGVLVSAGLRAGESVVTRGAALLLSEEQRPRGIATVCKDPPECDD